MAAEITVTVEVRAGFEKVAGTSVTRTVAGVPAELMHRDLEPVHFRILQDALAPELSRVLEDAQVQLGLRAVEAETRAQERAL